MRGSEATERGEGVGGGKIFLSLFLFVLQIFCQYNMTFNSKLLGDIIPPPPTPGIVTHAHYTTGPRIKFQCLFSTLYNNFGCIKISRGCCSMHTYPGTKDKVVYLYLNINQLYQFNSIQFYCPFLEMDNKRYFCSVSVHLKYFAICLSFELLLSSHLSLAKMSYGCSGDNGSRGMGVWVWIFHLVVAFVSFYNNYTTAVRINNKFTPVTFPRINMPRRAWGTTPHRLTVYRHWFCWVCGITNSYWCIVVGCSTIGIVVLGGGGGNVGIIFIRWRIVPCGEFSSNHHGLWLPGWITPHKNHCLCQNIINILCPIQGGPKITERHTSGNKDIRWLVSVDGVSSPEKNDTKISHFG